MDPKNILVLDIETQKSFKEVGGKSNLQKLKISVMGVYDYRTDKYSCYEEREILGFLPRLQEADLLIGFNIRRFDMMVLEPYLLSPAAQFPILDLLDAIEKHRGHRASLESVTLPTLKQHKSGHGADALILFEQKRMDELKRYCIDDVRLTKEVYDYGVLNFKIHFTSAMDYKTYEIPVDWKNETESLMQQAIASRQTAFPTSLF